MLLVQAWAFGAWQPGMESIATAVAAGFGILAAVFLFWQIKQVKRQLSLLESEQAARLRPWIAVSGISLVQKGKLTTTDGVAIQMAAQEAMDTVIIFFHNVGSVPATKVSLALTLSLEYSNQPEQNISEPLPPVPIGAIFPNESNRYFVQIRNDSPFETYTAGTTPRPEPVDGQFSLRGIFTYQSGSASYTTDFFGTMDTLRRMFSQWANTRST